MSLVVILAGGYQELPNAGRIFDNLSLERDEIVECQRNIRLFASPPRPWGIEKGAAPRLLAKDAAPCFRGSRKSDRHICIIRQQRDVSRADGLLTDGLEALLVKVHLAAVLLDDVLRQYRCAVAHEVGFEVVENDVIVVFDEAVDDTVDQQIVG